MLSDLKADLARYPGTGWRRLFTALRCAAFYAVALHRVGHDIYFRWPRVLAVPAKVPFKLLSVFTECATGIYIAPDATIGPGLYIGHWGGIRVGAARLGARCNLSPMVIIGFGMQDGQRGLPELGDRVYVGSGAKLLGPIHIGDDVAIGANAVVVNDVPDHVTVGGVPARIISRKGSAAYLQVGQQIEVVPGGKRPVSRAG